MRLAPLLLGGLLAACVPPAPRSVSGTLPSPGSYAIVAAETIAPEAQAALARALAMRGLVPAPAGQRPDRLVLLTLADRPLASGSFAGETRPVDRAADGWIDRPQKRGFLGRTRREVRLTIRFLSPDGQLREQRSATQLVRRNAPAPALARLIDAVLAP